MSLTTAHGHLPAVHRSPHALTGNFLHTGNARTRRCSLPQASLREREMG